jgi:hypothetical protein
VPELEIDRLRDLLQHQNKQQLQTNDSLQMLEEHASLNQSQDEQDSLQQQQPHVYDFSSVQQLNEMIDECQCELHKFGMEFGLEQQHDYVNVPRKIQMT